MVIAPGHLARTDEIRASFESNIPLERFVVLSDFLVADAADAVANACHWASFELHCMYKRRGETTIRWEFASPDPQHSYAAIQERVRALPEAMRPIANELSSREARNALSSMTGIDLSEATVATDSVTCLGPGAFLNRHTDAKGIRSDATRVVLNLAFTRAWHPEHGGIGHYRWQGSPREVRVIPGFNQAIVFVANDSSFHWVDPVAEHAPPRRRFTWTLTYEQSGPPVCAGVANASAAARA